MEVVINRKHYNTRTAKIIAHYSYCAVGNFKHFEEILYKKKTGEYFLYRFGSVLTKYSHKEESPAYFIEKIIPLSEDDAKSWDINRSRALENIF